jgi:predicted transcriptional regulator
MDYLDLIELMIPTVTYVVTFVGIIFIVLIVKAIFEAKYTMQYDDVFSERIMTISQTELDEETKTKLIQEVIKSSVTSEEKQV